LFVIGLDQDALLAAAVEANAVVVIAAHPGGSLVQGTPLAMPGRQVGC